VSVSVVFRDGPPEKLYQDRDWGHAEALRQVHQGADVLFAAGGDTALAALEAAAANGELVIGTETDLYPEFVDVRPMLLTSAVNGVRDGVLELLHLARKGQLPGGNYFGRASLSGFHDLQNSVPIAIRDRVLRLEQELDSGNLQPDIPYDNPSH
jgi:basic membrane lipoprotein Med (substrate-binding protein (PBP1-ABC) superfamily)